MMQGQFEVDPGAPVFFLSYARAELAVRVPEVPRDVNQKVYTLFSDLSDHVAELLALETGTDAGFVDRRLDGGQLWSNELRRAAGTCQVFVALLSAQYLRSKWCAREWNAFDRRERFPRPRCPMPDNTSLIPVIWSQIEDEGLPSAIAGMQRFVPTGLPPEFAPQYRQEGIYGLLSMGPAGRGTYEAVTWRLAQRIAAACRSHWVRPLIADSEDELGSSFGEDQR